MLVLAEREDSDVSVIIHQPFNNPYAGYRPPGFWPSNQFMSPYQIPPAYPYMNGKVDPNWYQNYYQNYYQNAYPGMNRVAPMQPVGASGVQHPPVRTVFQQDDKDRGGIKVVQMGGTDNYR